MSEWSDWIEHDGGECPVIGQFGQAIWDDSPEPDKPSVFLGNPSAWVADFDPHWFVKVIRYRVRKPRGLVILEELLASLPTEKTIARVE